MTKINAQGIEARTNLGNPEIRAPTTKKTTKERIIPENKT
jgi:hypothetical protein